jgi:hypothetical protein
MMDTRTSGSCSGADPTRHWVAAGETGVSLAREAALRALAKAGMRLHRLHRVLHLHPDY